MWLLTHSHNLINHGLCALVWGCRYDGEYIYGFDNEPLPQFQAMKVDFTMKLLILEQNISSQSQKIIRQDSALTQEGASLLSHITAVNSSLYQQIQSVSKMEGPRGPMGYNGSQVIYKQYYVPAKPIRFNITFCQ